MGKVNIKNVSSTTVSLFIPEVRFNRELVPGREISIDTDTYNELTFDSGFNTLVNNHYLAISGINEDEQVAVLEVGKVYDVGAIEQLLDKLDITNFANFIQTAAPAEKDTVVQLAVEKGITHPAFVSLIKKYCNVDIIALINMKHLAEE